MGKDILVSAADKTGAAPKPRGPVRMAVVSGGELSDFAIHDPSAASNVGNIYKGLVTNVFPGTQSCFVNIGHEKNAVLYASDLLPVAPTQKTRPVETLVRAGQMVVVQVLRDAAGEKGAHVTTKLALPGKYAVLLPESDQCAVSRRVADQRESVRLRGVALRHMPENCGLIIRTEAAGIDEGRIAEDIKSLAGSLSRMQKSEKGARVPHCIHLENDFYRDILFRALENEITRVVTDDRASYRELLGRAASLNPDISYKIQYYQESWPMFSFYGIQNDVNNLHSRRIWLKCGAYIVIDRTEALTVVDVNTGKYTGGDSQHETFLHVNKEAVVEAARQAKLRDIGGIIIIDALRMPNLADQREVAATLEAELAKDRQKSSVEGYTRLGLLEMTRKKAGTWAEHAAGADAWVSSSNAAE